MTARRKSLSRFHRVKIFDAAKGICHICGLPIRAERGEPWDVEHVVPLWANGPDEEFNMRPAHTRCHKSKSIAEATPRAKGTRVRANHLGIKKPRTITRWRRFNGEPVFASRERQ